MNWIALELTLLFIFTAITAYFSGTEVAYTSLNLSRIKRTHRLRPGYFELWEKRPELVLAVLLLANNAMGTAAGVLAAHMAKEIARLFYFKESIATLGCSFLVGTFLLIFGEIIPKIIAQQNSLPWALSATPSMKLVTRLLAPVANAAVFFINRILRSQRKKLSPTDVPLAAELKSILEHSTIPVVSKKIISNVIDFSKTQVREIMTPRNKILALSLKDPMNKIIESVIQSGYSRIPVYSGSFDNMVGILYSKDLLVSWRSHTLFLLEDLLRPVYAVEEKQAMGELMRVFKTGRHHLALVKDNLQKGKVTGLISLQDGLEALVGTIEEES